MTTHIHAVIDELRRRIALGHYEPGERLIELQLSAELGVSRTPIRLAFEKLTREGLLERLPTRGFRVRVFKLEELVHAIDVRGTLEGMAARLVAERGASSETLQCMQNSVDEGRALLDKALRKRGKKDLEAWASINAEFHAALVAGADNACLISALEHISAGPLVGAASVMTSEDSDALEISFLLRAQQDHEDVLSAIRQGEGARAENLMREHARRSRDNKCRLFENKGLYAPA